MTGNVQAPEVVTAESAAQYWAEVLAVFRDTHGREPLAESDDPSERRLARAAWGYRIPLQTTEAAATAPGIRVSGRAWWGRYEEYMAWKVRGLPPKNAHALNLWLHRQRCAARDGRLRAPFMAALENLDRELQQIRDSQEQAQTAAEQTELEEHTKAWFLNFRRLAVWHSSHGSMPRREGGGARERKLALWVACERAAAHEGLLTKEQLEALASVPGALA